MAIFAATIGDETPSLLQKTLKIPRERELVFHDAAAAEVSS